MAVMYPRFQYCTYLLKKKKTFDFRDGKNRNLLIKTKLIIIINYKLLLYTCNLFITNNYLLITNQK